MGAASRHAASSSRPSIDGACAARVALAMARALAATTTACPALGVAVCAARHDMGATTANARAARERRADASFLALMATRWVVVDGIPAIRCGGSVAVERHEHA